MWPRRSQRKNSRDRREDELGQGKKPSRRSLWINALEKRGRVRVRVCEGGLRRMRED